MYNISHKNKTAHQHIRMISEGSCDTADWNNDTENSALITEINKIYSNVKRLFEIVIIFHNITFFTVFFIK